MYSKEHWPICTDHIPCMGLKLMQEAAAAATALAQADQADWEAAEAGQWPFLRLADDLCADLLDAAWGRRHGAAIGLREILRSHAAAACVSAAPLVTPSGSWAVCKTPCNLAQSQLHISETLQRESSHHACCTGWVASEGSGKPRLAPVTPEAAAAAAVANAGWLEDCIIRIVCVLALDRFADFVSDQASTLEPNKPWTRTPCNYIYSDAVCDQAFAGNAQVVAPVRETAAQALGAAVQPLSVDALRVLLSQLQTLACNEQWEVRHSGLLALKYVVAARPDAAAQLLPLALSIAEAGLQV